MTKYELARDKFITGWFGALTLRAGTKILKVRKSQTGALSGFVHIKGHKVRINLFPADLRKEQEREAA